MKKNKVWILALCLVATNGSSLPAHAVQRYQFNELERIEGVISTHELNRVKIEGDRIKEVIGLSKAWQVESDSRNGQVFIKSLQETNEPAIFTVITEKGKTQDIRLMAKKVKGEVIIIETVRDGKKTEKSWGAKHKTHDEIVEVIRSAALAPVNSEVLETRHIAGIEASLLKSKKTGEYLVETWQLRNTGDDEIGVEEKNFKFVGSMVRAIGLMEHYLAPGEVTQMFVVKS